MNAMQALGVGPWGQPCCRWLCGVMVLLGLSMGVQADHGDKARAVLDIDFVQAKIADIEASQNLEEDKRERMLKRYRSALSDMRAAESTKAKTAVLLHDVDNAKGQLDKFSLEINRLNKKIKEDAAQGLQPLPSPSAAQANYDENRLLLTNLKGRKGELQHLVAGGATGEAELNEQLNIKYDHLVEVRVKLSELSNTRMNSRQAELLAQEQLAEAEVEHLKVSIDTFDTRIELAESEAEKVRLNIKFLEQRNDIYSDIINNSTYAQAQTARQEALALRHRAREMPSGVAQLALKTAALVEELAVILEKVADISAQTATIEVAETKVEEDFNAARSLTEVASNSAVVGQALTSRRRALEDPRDIIALNLKTESEIKHAELRHIQLSEERRSRDDVSTALEEQALQRWQAAAALPPEIESELGAVLGNRLPEDDFHVQLEVGVEEYLLQVDALFDAYGVYLEVLAKASYQQEQYALNLQAFQDFLSENLLWVPSVEIFSLDDLRAFPGLVFEMIGSMLKAGALLLNKMLEELALYALVLLFTGYIYYKRRHFTRGIHGMESALRQPQRDGFHLTCQALGLAVVYALPLPLLLWFLGWRLSLATEAVGSWGEVLQLISVVFFLYGLSRQLFRRRSGIAASHFGWGDATLTIYRRAHQLMLCVILPPAVIGLISRASLDTNFQSSVGRLSLIVMNVGIFLLLWLIFRAVKKGLIDSGYQGGGKYAWVLGLLAASLLIPVISTVTAILGYTHAAAILVACIGESVITFYLGVLIYGLATRWITVIRRRVRYEQLLEQARGVTATQATSADAGHSNEDKTLVDLNTLDEQTRRWVVTVLFFCGMFCAWFIWQKAFPTLDFLGNWVLWQDLGSSGEVLGRFTAQDLLKQLILFTVVVLVARDLPTVIEFFILSKLHLSAGSRYATRAILQYLLFGVGTVMVLSFMGLKWAKLQWLVAALSVGIGFGLQEIVANFISGLIILFERPIRVGDTVTVGELTGKVMRIRIRATTIVDWDNKEIVIPNRDLITGRVTNWTLSSAVTRVILNIRVAYGSDTLLVKETLLQLVNANPKVLTDPAPAVFFQKFGDSSLDFIVYAHVAELGDRLATTDELNRAIDQEFQRLGIEIPYPQRQLHISAVNDVSAEKPSTWPPKLASNLLGKAD